MPSQRRAGGRATASGMNFQGSVTAIAAVYLASGQSLGWLNGLVADVPVAIWAETGGGGDDLRLDFADGTTCEIQVKRGLKAGQELWVALSRLAGAVDKREVTYGALIVSSTSSCPVRELLARDLRQLGDGRNDLLSDIGHQLVERLANTVTSVQDVARKLRIVTVHATPDNDASIVPAVMQLKEMCFREGDAGLAWHRIVSDATEVIERGGRRTAVQILQILSSAGIALHCDGSALLCTLSRLRDWRIATCSTFPVLGFEVPMTLENAWLPLTAEIVGDHKAYKGGLSQAVAAYHGETNDKGADTVSAITIGRFRQPVVVIGGPGIGKSTLLKRLALTYAREGYPVFLARLSEVAARMTKLGASFEEAMAALGADTSGVTVRSFAEFNGMRAVMLCDGLDECGTLHHRVAEALASFSAGHPDIRVVVTTRPVGYETPMLKHWRHYAIRPPEWSDASRHVHTLLEEVLPVGSAECLATVGFADKQLESGSFRSLATRSPLLLGLFAALSMKRVTFGASRSEVYRQLFSLIKGRPTHRDDPVPTSSLLADAVIDHFAIAGHGRPAMRVAELMQRAADSLSKEMEISPSIAALHVEGYVAYWERRGLLETISHAGDSTVTFVHRSFGEFAAARVLGRLPSDERAETIATNLDVRDWDAVYDFAAGLGHFREIMDATLESSACPGFPKRLVRCLKWSGEARDVLSDEDCERLIKAAKPLLASPRRSIACDMCEGLLVLSTVHPGSVSTLGAEFIDHPQKWTRLIGWSLILVDEGAIVNMEALKEAFAHLPELIKPLYGGILGEGGGLNIGGYDLTDVMAAFVSRALERMLANGVDEIIIGMVRTVLKDESIDSYAVLNAASASLKAHGLHDLAKEIYRHHSPKFDLNRFIPETRDAHAKILEALAAALPPSKAVPESDEIQLHLSAFLTAVGYMSSSGDDEFDWSGQRAPGPLVELLSATIKASDVDPATMASEVAMLRARLRTEVAEGQPYSSFWLSTERVDAEIHWTRMKEFALDIAEIEQNLTHRATWVVQVAANTLLAILPDGDVEAFVRKHLDSGRGRLLWVAGGIAKMRLSKDVAANLLVERLEGPSAGGMHYLTRWLEDLVEPSSALAFRFLKAGLLLHDVDTAVVAANFISKREVPWCAAVESLVREAYVHWQAHEEPYPRPGGRIPHSPRATLLSLLYRHATFDFEPIMNHLSDPRTDVSALAEPQLIQCLARNPQESGGFVDQVLNGRVRAFVLKRALHSKVPLSNEDISRLAAFLQQGDEPLRAIEVAPVV